jgi:hypothetical protein
MADSSNDDLKARMKAALEAKQGHDGVAETQHSKAKGPAARGRQGAGNNMFRRKAGG